MSNLIFYVYISYLLLTHCLYSEEIHEEMKEEKENVEIDHSTQENR